MQLMNCILSDKLFEEKIASIKFMISKCFVDRSDVPVFLWTPIYPFLIVQLLIISALMQAVLASIYKPTY